MTHPAIIKLAEQADRDHSLSMVVALSADAQTNAKTRAAYGTVRVAMYVDAKTPVARAFGLAVHGMKPTDPDADEVLPLGYRFVGTLEIDKLRQATRTYAWEGEDAASLSSFDKPPPKGKVWLVVAMGSPVGPGLLTAVRPFSIPPRGSASIRVVGRGDGKAP